MKLKDVNITSKSANYGIIFIRGVRSFSSRGGGGGGWSRALSEHGFADKSFPFLISLRGPPCNLHGALENFVVDNEFISTGLGSALKSLNFITCLYRKSIEVNYFRPKLFVSKIFQPPPPPPGD